MLINKIYNNKFDKRYRIEWYYLFRSPCVGHKTNASSAKQSSSNLISPDGSIAIYGPRLSLCFFISTVIVGGSIAWIPVPLKQASDAQARVVGQTGYHLPFQFFKKYPLSYELFIW